MIDCPLYLGEKLTVRLGSDKVLALSIKKGSGQYKDDYIVTIKPRKIDTGKPGQYYLKTNYEGGATDTEITDNLNQFDVEKIEQLHKKRLEGLGRL